MISISVIADVRTRVARLYEKHNHDVPFHGWHHIEFVSAKSREFALELLANGELVEIAALVHDLNYLVDASTDARAGAQLRRSVLDAAGVKPVDIQAVETIVLEAETQSRGANISPEAKALSDADTLFKALPITPVVLAPLYMLETGQTLKGLAQKIVREQVPLNDHEIYFYSPSAQARYGAWGDANLRLWRCLLDSLDDPDVVELLKSVPSK